MNADETGRVADLLQRLTALSLELQLELRCDYVGKDSAAEIGVFTDGECLGFIEPTSDGYQLGGLS